MRLPESEKQKLIATVRNITNTFRKTCEIKIHSFITADGNLRVTMGDEYVKVGFSYSAQQFEELTHFIMLNHPGNLALYFGIFWQSELSCLYSFYSKELKKKAMKKVLDNCATGGNDYVQNSIF